MRTKEEILERKILVQCFILMANLHDFIITHFQFSISMTLSFLQCIAFLARLITVIRDYLRWLKDDGVQGSDKLSHIQHKFLSAKSQPVPLWGLWKQWASFQKTRTTTPLLKFLLLQLVGNSATTGENVLFFNSERTYLNAGLMIKKMC